MNVYYSNDSQEYVVSINVYNILIDMLNVPGELSGYSPKPAGLG